MAERSILSDILSRAAGSGLLRRMAGGGAPQDPEALCHELLGDKGEISGLVTALDILERYEAEDRDGQLAFFQMIATTFGVDQAATEAAIAAWNAGDEAAARALHYASEPRSQELIRRLNRTPGATARLVRMRADLRKHLRDHPDLEGLDRDFRHLFGSWFNRGFLEMRHIDWSTSAAILEKIIGYEAVHEITGWDDLRQRVADPDRLLFAFFHPAMPGDPLIFVEVALTNGIPGAIAPILRRERDCVAPQAADTAVFYSISNCQKGLRGISFGNFLIKQVVSELQRDWPQLKTFVTLSPVPGLRRWAGTAEGELLSAQEAAALQPPDEDALPDPGALTRIAARYLTRAKRPGGTVFDPVAHFHLGNGAMLHAVHPEADLSETGIANSWGVMVNYLYDGDSIERNHQAYATEGRVAMSSAVRALARG